MPARLVFAIVDLAARKGPAETGANAFQKVSPNKRSDKARARLGSRRNLRRSVFSPARIGARGGSDPLRAGSP
jgi:hypothetical protein